MSGFIPFIFGFLGVVAFTLFRFLESKREQRFFPRLRATLDTYTSRVYRALVLGDIPDTYRAETLRAVRHTLHQGAVSLVSLLRSIERPLINISHRMRVPHRYNQTERDPSPFLKDIVEKRTDGDSPTH